MIIASALSNGTSTPGLVEQVQLLILLLIVTLIVALLARLMRVPYTLLLVIVGFLVGIVVGLMPFLPHEHLDPNLVLYIFIPALLFEGAWNAELDRLNGCPSSCLQSLACCSPYSWSQLRCMLASDWSGCWPC